MHAIVLAALFPGDVGPTKAPVPPKAPETIQTQVKGGRLVTKLRVPLYTMARVPQR